MGDDLVGDLDLAAHGVDGDQCAFELLGLGEFVEEIRDGGDLVGLFRHAELRQDQPRRGRVGAERMQGFEPFAVVVGAPRRLAVDSDEVVPVRPQRRHPAVEAASEQDRIDPIDEHAHPALARNAVMEFREPAQEIEMVLAPGDNVVEIVARGDRRAGDQQQHLLERIHHPPRFAVIPKFGKMLQQKGHSRPRYLFVQDRSSNRGHASAPCRIRAPTESQPSRQLKMTPHAPVNLTSQPWTHSHRQLIFGKVVVHSAPNEMTRHMGPGSRPGRLVET